MFSKRGSGWSRVDVALLLLLLCIAFGFRAVNLDQQSLNCDEYHTIITDRDTSWQDYWAFARSVNPDHVPLYFILTFAWGKVFGSGLEIQRLFPVIASCLLLVPIYAMGRRWFGGRRAAVIACLYLALSPTMIWHGQYLRANALLLLVAACSLWSFMHAVEHGGRRWWCANWALNAVMLLLHIVGSLMLLPLGLYLLVTRRWRAMFAWGMANALLLLPWFFMSAVGRLDSLGNSIPPGLPALFALLLGDDFLTIRNDMERQLFEDYDALVLAGARYWYSVGSDGLRAVVMVGLLGTGILAAWRYRGRFNPNLLAALVTFVPALFLYVVSVAWITVEQTSHSIVAFAGLALLLGGGIASLRGRALRAAATLAIFVPLSVYACLVTHIDTRSNNLAVSELIRERAELTPMQVVVVDCCWVNDIILPLLIAANLDVAPDQIGGAIRLPPEDAPYQLRVVHTFQTVIDLIEARPGLAPLPDEFIVVASIGTTLGRRDRFTRQLKRLGIHTEFHAISDYRVWVCRRSSAHEVKRTERFFSIYDYRGYLQRAGFVPESKEDWQRARRALRRGVSGWGFESYSHEHYMAMLLFVAEYHPRLATVLARDAIAREGSSSSLLLALGVSLVAGGNMEEARAPLEEFIQKDDVNDRRYRDMVLALLAGDWPGYRAAMEVFVDRRFICPRIFQRLADIPERGPIRPEDFDCADCVPREAPEERILPHLIGEELNETPVLAPPVGN